MPVQATSFTNAPQPTVSSTVSQSSIPIPIRGTETPKSGDGWSTVAFRAGVDLERLRKVNPDIGDYLEAGKPIKIPEAETEAERFAKASEVAQKANQYYGDDAEVVSAPLTNGMVRITGKKNPKKNFFATKNEEWLNTSPRSILQIKRVFDIPDKVLYEHNKEFFDKMKLKPAQTFDYYELKNGESLALPAKECRKFYDK